MRTEPAKNHIPARETELPGGWEGLALAVIYQACADYRQARRTIRCHPDSRKANAAIRQLERFFTSAWFHTLTSLDGRAVLKALKEETR